MKYIRDQQYHACFVKNLLKFLSSVFAKSDASDDELMKLERSAFMKLLSSGSTQERISCMLANGKKLKN